LQTPRMHIACSRLGKILAVYFHGSFANFLYRSHPPTYYLPPEDVNTSALKQNSRHTFCEWKGSASYFDFKPSSGDTVKSRIWTYETPSSRFKPIKGYFSFYAGPWKCYVDDEEVKPQPGDFYGGESMSRHNTVF
jgi:uncharacterized protein (DUF427 family)